MTVPLPANEPLCGSPDELGRLADALDAAGSKAMAADCRQIALIRRMPTPSPNSPSINEVNP